MTFQLVFFPRKRMSPRLSRIAEWESICTIIDQCADDKLHAGDIMQAADLLDVIKLIREHKIGPLAGGK